MELNNQIHPTKEQFRKLVANYPADQPVIMINILKYREMASKGNKSGISTYERYGQNVIPFMKKVGAQLLWRGKVNSTLIGDSKEQPDNILLVRYPTLQHFIDMTSDPEYVKISEDRYIALEYGGLWACEEEFSAIG